MSAGNTNSKRGPAGKRRGLKKHGNQEVMPNDIIIRQKGMKFHPGKNTFMGSDFTIHSEIEGVVYFERSHRSFKTKKKMQIIHVVPNPNPNTNQKPPAPYNYHPELYPERAEFNTEHLAYEKKEKPDNSNKELKMKNLKQRGQKVEDP